MRTSCLVEEVVNVGSPGSKEQNLMASDWSVREPCHGFRFLVTRSFFFISVLKYIIVLIQTTVLYTA